MFKKIIRSLIVCLMVCSSINTVYANEVTGSITVKNDVESTGLSIDGEVVGLYQILERDGYSYKVCDDYVAHFDYLYNEANSTLDMLDFVIAYLNQTSDYEVMNGLYEYTVEHSISSNYQQTVSQKEGNAEFVEFDDIELGYYLIVQGTSELVPVASTFITESNQDVEVYLKASKPTLDKEVYNNNTGDYSNSNTAGIGDEVQYKITTLIPDITSYSKYDYIVHDSMSAGLTFNENVVIMINDHETENNVLSHDYYTVDKTSNQNFTVVIDVFKAVEDKVLEAKDVLSIYYSATLNGDAIKEDYSTNSAYLEYSNNPFTDETSSTVEVEVKTYTLKLNVLKISSNQDMPLQGVEFNMTINGEKAYFVYKDEMYVLCSIEDKDSSSVLVTDEFGKLTIIGLNDYDEYSFIEIKPLEGYLNIDDIEFEFKVSYDEFGNLVFVTSVEDGLDQDGTNLALDLIIKNYREIDLPSTGGMGSSMFIVAGSIIVIGSLMFMSVLLFKNRKISDDEIK